MKNQRISHIAVVTLFAAAPAVSAAGPFSWFDGAQPADFAADAWTPKYAAFSLDLYRSADSAVESPPDDVRDNDAGDSMRLFGGVDHGLTLEAGLSRPTETQETPYTARRLRALGLAWQHRLDSANYLTASAGYGNGSPLWAPTPEWVDTRATVSLSSRWQNTYYQPRVTGSVFVGGESATPEAYRMLGRRYYGLAVGGELTLQRAHTPYVSFQIQRSLSAGEDTLMTSALDDDRSQIAAGWKWQAQRHLSLQAEASLGYNGGRLRLQNTERSRVFFGTRFDFK